MRCRPAARTRQSPSTSAATRSPTRSPTASAAPTSAPCRSPSTRRRSPRCSCRRARRSAPARRRSSSPTSPTSGCASSTSTCRTLRSQAALRSPSGPRSPTAPRSPSSAPLADFAPFAERAPLAGTPLSEVAGRLPGRLAGLLVGTRFAGEPTQSITFEQFLALYDPPGPPTQALRELTLEDIALLRRHAPGRRQPCRVPDRRHAARQLHFGVDRDVVRPRARPTRRATNRAPRSVSVPATTLMELDVEEAAAAVLAAHPDLRRIPMRPQPGGLRRRARDGRPAQRAQPVRHADRAGQRRRRCRLSPAIGSVRIADIPIDDSNPDDGPYGRRDLVVDCAGAFACTAAATLADAKAAGALQPGAKLQDVGRAFFDHTVGRCPADRAHRRSAPCCPPRSTSTT